jgi:N utilization substance protein B
VSGAAPGSRRRAREAALQILYAADVSGCLEPEAIEATLAEVIVEFELPVRARERARELVLGVSCNRKRIDEQLASASAHWKLHRMAAVERNLLRVGVFELLFEPGTPVEVVIDEAVEIARRFGGEGATGFVNGILDHIARTRDPAVAHGEEPAQ